MYKTDSYGHQFWEKYKKARQQKKKETSHNLVYFAIKYIERL